MSDSHTDHHMHICVQSQSLQLLGCLLLWIGLKRGRKFTHSHVAGIGFWIHDSLHHRWPLYTGACWFMLLWTVCCANEVLLPCVASTTSYPWRCRQTLILCTWGMARHHSEQDQHTLRSSRNARKAER